MGANVNTQGRHYDQAAFEAALSVALLAVFQVGSAEGDEKVVKLLDNGADVNAQGGHYGNAIQAASVGGHMGVVQLLLDKGSGWIPC
jgi:hypothetical protein